MQPSSPGRTPAFMVLGTTSHAGKSTVAAGLCRLLARRGLRVAPFKAQNMSLNSHVTPQGGEIGRAQAVQARAAGTETHVDMNPVLLKPTGEGLMQVIVAGRAVGNFTAREYYARKGEMRREARRAYDRLAARHGAMVLEGAGSPAEINLRREDFVNASMAEYAGARCLLVADIERGGVFASILGTIRLLPPRHRKLLAGVIINKFRGDVSLLKPGLEEIARITGVPVLGVLPFLKDLDLEEEDSLGLEGRGGRGPALADVSVVRLPYLSNFTDFQPLERIPGLSLRYVDRPESMGNPDLIILPGSKNVRHDMEFLVRTGLARNLAAAAARGIPLFGICGGYQMLGLSLQDPLGMEGNPGETPGLGLLPVETVLEREKELCRVEARNLCLPFLPAGAACSGYEIHMGRTRAVDAGRASRKPGRAAWKPGRTLLRVESRNGAAQEEDAGFHAGDLPVFGCYLHGLFESEAAARGLFRWLVERKGLEWKPEARTAPGGDEAAFDRVAAMLETHADLDGFLLT